MKFNKLLLYIIWYFSAVGVFYSCKPFLFAFFNIEFAQSWNWQVFVFCSSIGGETPGTTEDEDRTDKSESLSSQDEGTDKEAKTDKESIGEKESTADDKEGEEDKEDKDDSVDEHVSLVFHKEKLFLNQIICLKLKKKFMAQPLQRGKTSQQVSWIWL